MIEAKRVTLAAAAAAVEVVGAADTGHPGRHVTVRNNDATNQAQLGGPGLTNGAGYRLAAGGVVQLTLQHGDTLHALSDLGAALDVLVAGA